MKMNAKLQEDTSQTVVEDRKSKNKQRRASKSGLCDFTNKKRKTKKRKNAINGWSVKGKQYMCKMIGKITQDEQSRHLQEVGGNVPKVVGSGKASG